MERVFPPGTWTSLAACAALSIGTACGPVHSVTVGHSPPPHAPDVVGDAHHGHGPPPHAPAHGYRWKHRHAYRHASRDVELVFDSGLGVYVVVGLPSVYFWNGAYLRIDGGRWYTSAQLDDGWHAYRGRELPHALRAKHAGKAHKKGHAKGRRGKGNLPAKQR